MDGPELTRGKPAHINNTGDSDIAVDSTPSQFLLFRALEASVNEDVLAKGAAKLNKSDENENENIGGDESRTNTTVVTTAPNLPIGARVGSIRRVLLVRDRRSNESWRYGFVEYGAIEVTSLIVSGELLLNKS